MRREAALVMQVKVELSQRSLRLSELAKAPRRFGYRRLQILLQRED